MIPILGQAKAFAPWLLAGALVLVSGYSARGCAERRLLEADRARLEEEARARAAEVPVVQVVTQRVVDEEAEKAKRENPELRAELTRAAKEIGKLRALLVVRGTTAPTPVTAQPLPAPEGCPRCQLGELDQLELAVDGVGVEGEEGATMLVATLEASRVSDGALLARAPLSAPVTVAFRTPAVEAGNRARWRAGPVGGVSGQGWLAGAALVSPELRLPLLGWYASGTALAAGGTGGTLLLGGVLVRPP